RGPAAAAAATPPRVGLRGRDARERAPCPHRARAAVRSPDDGARADRGQRARTGLGSGPVGARDRPCPPNPVVRGGRVPPDGVDPRGTAAVTRTPRPHATARRAPEAPDAAALGARRAVLEPRRPGITRGGRR